MKLFRKRPLWLWIIFAGIPVSCVLEITLFAAGRISMSAFAVLLPLSAVMFIAPFRHRQEIRIRGVLSEVLRPGYDPEELEVHPDDVELLEELAEKLSDRFGTEAPELLSTQAEMRALQNQINPHFLYNTLETIRSKAIFAGAEEVAEMIEALGRLLRYSLSQPGDMASFEDEIGNVENYVLIQKYRFRDRFRMFREFDEEDEYLMNYMMPVLTLQPIVENAILHGLEGKVSGGKITIRAFTTQNVLKIIVSDNGTGMDDSELAALRKKIYDMDPVSGNPVSAGGGQHIGIAMANVNRRIRFFYGKEYGLEVTSVKGHGTSVEITLPKIYDYRKGGPHAGTSFGQQSDDVPQERGEAAWPEF